MKTPHTKLSGSGSKNIWTRLLFVLTTVGWMQNLQADPTSLDGYLNLSQVISKDDQTDRTIAYSQLRSLVDYNHEAFSLHLDGRGRFSWNQERRNRIDISRFSAHYGYASGWFDMGRLINAAAASARIDGLEAGFNFGKQTSVSIFAGLMPHPWDASLNTDFTTAGLSYRTGADNLQAAGGFVLQLYQQDADRAYFAHNLSWRPNESWVVFANTTFDFLSPRGILGDLEDKNPNEQNSLERIDLTNGYLLVHYREKKKFDLSFRLSHHHTILPSAWWRDWIDEQRKRVGFVVDGEDPIGTRRTSSQLSANFYLHEALTPYTSVRLDYRHSDDKEGYEARAGAKLNLATHGFIDLFYSYRRHYIADNHLASLRTEWDLWQSIVLEAGFGAMHHTVLETSTTLWLYDLDVGMWIDMRMVSDSLKGLRCLLQAQAYIEPQITVYMGFVQLVYRLGS